MLINEKLKDYILLNYIAQPNGQLLFYIQVNEFCVKQRNCPVGCVHC